MPAGNVIAWVVVIVWMGMIMAGPFAIAAAIREAYRRVVLTDRGLAAVTAAIFSAYLIATMLLPVTLFAPPVANLLLWGAVGFAGIFVVGFPLTVMMIPSLKHFLRNVPRAERK